MTHTLRIEIYKTINPIVISTTWECGIIQAQQLSEYAKQNNWTRHPSCEGSVQHMGQYFDLYNEGAITLKYIE